MSKCPVCKYARCRWIDIKDPAKATLERLETVVNHNIGFIEMTFNSNNNGSALAEERMYSALGPYTEEIEKRKAKE